LISCWPPQIFEAQIAGVTIQAPQLDIRTVAAGGGSRFFFREGLFAVGPESVRAHPGPVCYRKGGFLATTDANAVLGRVRPELFPAIFGPNEDQPLDVDGARVAFEALLKTQIRPFFASQAAKGEEMSIEEAAYGFIKVERKFFFSG